MTQPIAKIAFPVILVLHLGVKVCFPGVFNFDAHTDNSQDLSAFDLEMSSDQIQFQTAVSDDLFGPTAVLVRQEAE